MQNTKISPQEFIALLEKLLTTKIPAEEMIALGAAIATLNLDDWKAVAGSVFIKDVKPIYHSSKKKIVSLKEIKNLVKNSRETLKGAIRNATFNIPEAKDRLGKFSRKIVTDYNQLQTNEERGNYILKLSLYASVFGLAFHRGSKQKMLSKSTLPLIVLGVTLVFINRVLERAEEKLGHNPGAKNLARDLRSLLRTLNTGFTSGMTMNVMVDGIVGQKIEINDLNGRTIGSLMPKSIIDNMIYATLMGLFSNEAK